MSVYNPARNALVESFVGIEVRGKSSAGMKRKSLGFAPLRNRVLENKMSLSFLGMPANNKWSLDVMYID